MRLRAQSPDQYHAFTARLAASGRQRTTMRVVAFCILALGLPAAVAAAAPRTSATSGRVALLVIAFGCVALAVPWLRDRWPSRTESAVVVTVGALALCVGCLVPADPRSGLLVATAFPFVLGYTALFHSTRLLALIVGLSAATIVVLAVRIAVPEPATAIAVTIPVALLCVITTFACRTIADVGSSQYSADDIDPVTGLLTRESFYDRTATLLGARNRTDDRYLVVAVVDIDTIGAITSLQGGRGVNRARVAAGQALRETVRRDAILAHSGESEFLIADTFTVDDPAPLVSRALSAIAATPSGTTASIGVVSTPLQPLTEGPPDDVLDDIITLASGAAAQARAAGGNQARYVIDPLLGHPER